MKKELSVFANELFKCICTQVLHLCTLSTTVRFCTISWSLQNEY